MIYKGDIQKKISYLDCEDYYLINTDITWGTGDFISTNDCKMSKRN